MAQDKQKAQYAPPTSQVDLAARQESGNASDRILSTSDQAAERDAEQEVDEGHLLVVEGNKLDGYVGTDPIYQNYANKTEAPLVAQEGDGDDNPENKLFAENFGQMPQRAWDVSEETIAKLQGEDEGELDEDYDETLSESDTEPQLSQPTPGTN